MANSRSATDLKSPLPPLPPRAKRGHRGRGFRKLTPQLGQRGDLYILLNIKINLYRGICRVSLDLAHLKSEASWNSLHSPYRSFPVSPEPGYSRCGSFKADASKETRNSRSRTKGIRPKEKAKWPGTSTWAKQQPMVRHHHWPVPQVGFHQP